MLFLPNDPILQFLNDLFQTWLKEFLIIFCEIFSKILTYDLIFDSKNTHILYIFTFKTISRSCSSYSLTDPKIMIIIKWLIHVICQLNGLSGL